MRSAYGADRAGFRHFGHLAKSGSFRALSRSRPFLDRT